MFSLNVLICHVALRLRHVSTLKEKRNAFAGAFERLRAMGFSVAECGDRACMKELHVGLSLVGSTASTLSKTIDKAMDMMRREFEVIKVDREIMTYEPSDEEDLSSMASPEDDVKD